jgi:hypothetical protein
VQRPSTVARFSDPGEPQLAVPARRAAQETWAQYAFLLGQRLDAPLLAE